MLQTTKHHHIAVQPKPSQQAIHACMPCRVPYDYFHVHPLLLRRARPRISPHCFPPTHRLLFWHFALSELRSTSAGYEQTSDRLHSCVNTDENTKRQQGVIDESLFARLGACLEVEQWRVNETKRDTDMSSDQTTPSHKLTMRMLRSMRQTCPAPNCPPMTAGSRKQRFPLGKHSSAT